MCLSSVCEDSCGIRFHSQLAIRIGCEQLDLGVHICLDIHLRTEVERGGIEFHDFNVLTNNVAHVGKEGATVFVTAGVENLCNTTGAIGVGDHDQDVPGQSLTHVYNKLIG